jgi:O-antigen ligase
LLCSGAIVLLFIPIRRPGLRLVVVTLGISFFLVALGVGSRGPVVAFALAVLLVGTARVVTSPRRLVPTIGIALAIGFAITSVTLPEVSRERLDTLGEAPGETFASEDRASFWAEALELTKQHPFRGAGVGGYASVGNQTTEAGTIYPHNLFLELSSELGIVPTIALLVALVGVLARIAAMIPQTRTRDSQLVHPVAGLLIFTLLAAQFSSDVNGNREFWGMLGLAWLMTHSRRAHPMQQADESPSGSRTAGAGA